MNKKIIYFVSSFTLLFVQFLQTQTKQVTDSLAGVYPLQVGNVWQYWTYDYLNGQYTWIYGWTEKVIGDTIMSSAQKYFLISSDKKFTKIFFLRQEQNQVFQFTAGKDSLIYDYSKHKGDIFLIVPVTNEDTLFQIVKDERFINYFGQSRNTWIYYTFFSKITYYEEKDIVDGIGMGYFLREGGDEWFLRGAIINGVKYGTITSVKEKYYNINPVDFEIFPNYPNPFNATTTISFYIKTEQSINVSVYDMLGRKVISLLNNRKPSGFHKMIWNGKNEQGNEQSSGVYIFRIQSETGFKQMKMLMVK